MKRVLILAVCGALAGVLVTSLTAPSLIGWYYTPGGTSTIHCGADIVAAMGTLLRAQLIIGAVFAVGTIIAGLLVARAVERRRQRNQPQSGPVAPPAAPTA